MIDGRFDVTNKIRGSQKVCASTIGRKARRATASTFLLFCRASSHHVVQRNQGRGWSQHQAGTRGRRVRRHGRVSNAAVRGRAAGLWTAWADIADDEEIEIGKVRVYHQPNADGSQKIQMKLHDLPKHHNVPKLYDLSSSRGQYNNTVVFSERDQPGFKAWNPNRVRKDTRGMNYRVNKNKPYTSSIPSIFLSCPVTLRMLADIIRTNRSRRLRQGRDGCYCCRER
jgi:hypothetical protein